MDRVQSGGPAVPKRAMNSHSLSVLRETTPRARPSRPTQTTMLRSCHLSSRLRR
jgi:hypothetical protein